MHSLNLFAKVSSNEEHSQKVSYSLCGPFLNGSLICLLSLGVKLFNGMEPIKITFRTTIVHNVQRIASICGNMHMFEFEIISF